MNEFILHSDHKALKFVQGQHKLSLRHAKWVEYLQPFHFIIHHKSGQMNKGTDALSRRYLLLSTLETKVLGFECVKGMYAQDEDFKEILEKCSQHAYGLFHLEDGFLFKRTRLCIPRCGFRELLIQELHGEPWPGTLVWKRLVLCSKIPIIGRTCPRTWCTLSKDAQFANMPRVTQGPKAFTLPFLSLKAFGTMWAWISSWVCQGHKGTRILSWRRWIGSPEWPTF